MTEGVRFGVLVLTDAPFATLFERWHRVEELGFDFLFAPDHARHTHDPSQPWFDGLTALTAMALQTSTIRIGTLVANPLLRPPSTLAKAASAIDHLSNGRLELGIGMGVEEFDHREVGSRYWDPKERAARFREYVGIVDGVLRSADVPYSFEGRYYQTSEASIAPPPPQRPRPPVLVGARSRTARAVAVDHGDCWNTYGLAGEEPVDEIVKRTRRRNDELDEWCVEAGRDPRSLRRSIVFWPPLDPWAEPNGFARLVDAFHGAAVNEFVVMWPGDERVSLLEEAAAAMVSLRSR